MTRSTSTLATAILRFLLKLAQGGAGFERRGVTGWASVAEIHTGTGCSALAEDLAVLLAAGMVSRDDARIARTRAPVWVYRITDAGAQHIAGEHGAPHASVPAPDEAEDERVYVRPGVAAALRALTAAKTEALSDPVLPDAPEWRTSRQLTRALDGNRFFSDELAWVVAAGLAERRDDPTILYRITAAGQAVKAMEWREPADAEPATAA
jgi:hypothetical protein